MQSSTLPGLQFCDIQIGFAVQSSPSLHVTLLHRDLCSGTLHLFMSHVSFPVLHDLRVAGHLSEVPFLQFFFVQIGFAAQLSPSLHEILLHFVFLSGTLHLFSSHVLPFEHVFSLHFPEHLQEVPF